jgi:hypothetical protein
MTEPYSDLSGPSAADRPDTHGSVGWSHSAAGCTVSGATVVVPGASFRLPLRVSPALSAGVNPRAAVI